MAKKRYNIKDLKIAIAENDLDQVKTVLRNHAYLGKYVSVGTVMAEYSPEHEEIAIYLYKKCHRNRIDEKGMLELRFLAERMKFKRVANLLTGDLKK